MKKNYKRHPYEFLFLINNKPIVGRNFEVPGFDRSSLRSVELKNCIDNVVGMIQEQFKDKTYDYLYWYHDPYMDLTDPEVERIQYSGTNVYENEDLFTFQIKYKGRVVMEKIFSGNDYPPKVRYDVDIRKIIPKIIDQIQYALSLKKYTRELQNYEL
jgi:hypothetical protein